MFKLIVLKGRKVEVNYYFFYRNENVDQTDKRNMFEILNYQRH